MIDPDFRQKLEDAEEHAPKRLTRKDVANLRALFQQTMSTRSEKYEGSLVIWLSRDPREVAISLLGRAAPGVRVTTKWRTRHVVGIDVEIRAFTALGSRTKNFSQKIAQHRFREGTSITQFCREVSHAARLGLGWAHYKTKG